MVYKNYILLKYVQYYWKSNSFKSVIKIVIKR